MKTGSTTTAKERSLFYTLLEEVRLQGSKDVPRPLFTLLFAICALCFIGTIILLSNLGIDLIEANLPKGSRGLALLLLFAVMFMGARLYVKGVFILWTFTKSK